MSLRYKKSNKKFELKKKTPHICITETEER